MELLVWSLVRSCHANENLFSGMGGESGDPELGSQPCCQLTISMSEPLSWAVSTK